MIRVNQKYRIFGRTKSRKIDNINSQRYFSLLKKYKINDLKHDKYILDIGSGYGETSIYFAEKYRKHTIVSCDKYINGNLKLLKTIERKNFLNLFLYDGNVYQFLDNLLKKNYFDKVLIFFPDPWPKKKHFKRRLVNSNFLEYLHQYLNKNAEIYICTDSKSYTAAILKCINKQRNLYNWINSKDLHLDIKDYFQLETKFYKKAIISGRIPSLLILKKI